VVLADTSTRPTYCPAPIAEFVAAAPASELLPGASDGVPPA